MTIQMKDTEQCFPVLLCIMKQSRWFCLLNLQIPKVLQCEMKAAAPAILSSSTVNHDVQSGCIVNQIFQTFSPN